MQWVATVALNGWISSGGGGAGYPVHMIEHTVSAWHGIAHATGPNVINPAWMRFAAQADPSKFAQFAERIFGLTAREPDDLECALAGSDRFEVLDRSIGCQTRFSELDFDDRLIEPYAKETLRIVHDDEGLMPARPAMSEADIVGVLRAAM